MQRALLLSSGFLALFLTVGLARADQMKFNAVLAPGPGVTSSGKGTATAIEESIGEIAGIRGPRPV